MSAERKRRSVTAVLGSAILAAIGAGVLIGGQVDAPLLTGIQPGLASMKADTALGLILCSYALWQLGARAAAGTGWPGQACAALAALIGLATLLEHFSGLGGSVADRPFSGYPHALWLREATQMPIHSSLALLMGSVSLLILTVADGRRRRLVAGAAFALATTLLGVLGLGGPIAEVAPRTMSLESAAAFTLLGTACLAHALRAADWRFSLSVPVAVGSGLVLLLVLGLSLEAMRSTHQFVEMSAKVRQDEQVRMALGDLNSVLSMALRDERGFVATGSEGQLGSYQREIQQGLRASQRLRELATDSPSQMAHIEKLDELLREKVEVVGEVIGARRSGDADPAALLARSRRGQELARMILALSRQLHSQQRNQLMARESEAAAVIERAYLVHPLGTLFSVALALVVLLQLNAEVDERKLAEARIHKLNTDLDQRVAQRTAELEVANRELEAFTYSVSHDLRAPLRGIDSFSRMVVEDYGSRLDDEGRRMLQVVRSESQRMGQLIDDLLSFSRAGRVPLRRASIDMASLVREVIDRLPIAPHRKDQIAVADLPPAYGDRGLVQQVWSNLVMNALKFSSKEAAPAIEVGATTGGGRTTYYVRDNGAGFDERYIHKLFGVFQRLHSEEEFEGTGVGLALVQRIIHRHGGHVRAEGKVNQGATFYFSLPASEDLKP